MDAPTNRRGWAERVGRFSPTYYAELGPNKVSRSLATVADHFLDADGAILEVGCSSGRHLAHLRRQGYDCLTGVDINDESFDVMAEYFPALAATGTFHTGPIEDVLPAFDTGRFDMVYSVETLQHVHPDSVAVFGDLARVTDGVLVTVENEGTWVRRGRTRMPTAQTGMPTGRPGAKTRTATSPSGSSTASSRCIAATGARSSPRTGSRNCAVNRADVTPSACSGDVLAAVALRLCRGLRRPSTAQRPHS